MTAVATDRRGTTRLRWAAVALIVISSGVLAMRLLGAHQTANYCSDAGFGPGLRYDAALGRCVDIADPIHYSLIAEALDGVFAAALLCLLLGIVGVFRGKPFWPFTVFQRRKYERAHAAAVVVLVGYYDYSKLSAADQRRVDADILVQLTGTEDRFIHRWEWDAVGALRAVAMARLGIAPVDVKESWEVLLKRWPPNMVESFLALDLGPWTKSLDLRAMHVFFDYHPFNPATEAAKASLRQAGMQIPEFDPGFNDPFPQQRSFEDAARDRSLHRAD